MTKITAQAQIRQWGAKIGCREVMQLCQQYKAVETQKGTRGHRNELDNTQTHKQATASVPTLQSC